MSYRAKRRIFAETFPNKIPEVQMAAILLIVVFLCFMIIGVPFSILGVVWPGMRAALAQPLEALATVQLVIILGSIFASLFSAYLIRKVGTGKLIVICCLAIGLGMLGVSSARSIMWVYIFVLPLGLGTGVVESAMNIFVAENYKPRYMNWMHSFWGVGSVLAPLRVTQLLAKGESWRAGAKSVGTIVLVVAVIALLSLPIWKKSEKRLKATAKADNEKPTHSKPWRIKGVKSSLLLFYLYVGVEFCVITWLVSFLTEYKSFTVIFAGIAQSVLFAGMTVGRISAGVIVGKLGNRFLIKAGMLTAIAGSVLLFLASNNVMAICGVALTGLGYAPIYPCMMHESATRFKGGSQKEIVSYQVGIGNVSVATFPVVLGYLAKPLTLAIVPFTVIIFMAVSLAVLWRLNKVT